jgi:hypothetical protein
VGGAGEDEGAKTSVLSFTTRAETIRGALLGRVRHLGPAPGVVLAVLLVVLLLVLLED